MESSLIVANELKFDLEVVLISVAPLCTDSGF